MSRLIPFSPSSNQSSPVPLLRRYKNDREIAAMQALVQAYQRRDVHEAEKILRSAFLFSPPNSPRLTSLSPAANRETIMDDPFIRFYIDDVLRSLRTQWILEIIKPYTRIEIAYLARVSFDTFLFFPVTVR